MKQQALGLIETGGLVAAIEAADAALKAASVELITYEKVTGGLVTVAVTGEVAAVQAAVEAGSAAAARVGTLICRHVIPRPLADIELLIKGRPGGDPSGGPAGGPADSPAGEPFSRTHLDSLAVEELRRLARKTEGIAIKGRQISRANKEQLITELMRALNPAND